MDGLYEIRYGTGATAVVQTDDFWSKINAITYYENYLRKLRNLEKMIKSRCDKLKMNDKENR